MRKALFVSILSMVLSVSFIALSFAGIPQVINYQGKLTDSGGNPVTGTKSVVFKLYDDPTVGNTLWTETLSVSVSNGVFNVLLGSVTPIPATAFSGDSVYLGVKVESDAEMTPRQRIATVGYSYMSGGVNVKSTGSNAPVFVNMSGTGNAGLFMIKNRLSPSGSAALYASTNGSGVAGYFGNSKADTANPAILVSSTGSGPAAEFLCSPSGIFPSVVIETYGANYALRATSNNSTPLAAKFDGKVDVYNGSLTVNSSFVVDDFGNASMPNLNVTGSITGDGSGLTSIPISQGGKVYAALSNGTTAMGFGTRTCVKVTPTATATYTTTAPAAGVQCTVIILTSGTTSYTITFGSGFRANGTLATGTTSAKYHTVSFISDGTTLIETGRATAASGF